MSAGTHKYTMIEIRDTNQFLDSDNNLWSLCNNIKSRYFSFELINCIFDILTAIISLLDLITDIIVTIQYYSDGKYAFFIPSLLILISAQISYCIIFTKRYKLPKEMEESLSQTQQFMYCIPLILISPMLSFVFYFASKPEAKLTKFLENKFNLRLQVFVDDNDDDENMETEPKIIKWMKEKLGSHIGFMTESLIESFPGSIVQITAMSIYGEINIICIISILLSLLSMSTKSFIICVGAAIDTLTIIFMWICIVIDVVGIFTVISFISSYHNDLLFQIWFYKIIIFIIPGSIIICLSIAILIILDYLRRPHKYKGNIYSISFGLFFFLIFLIPLLCLFAEMVCWSIIGGIIFINGELQYLPWFGSLDARFWKQIVDFITYRNYGNIANKYKNWRIQKISCINYIALNDNYKCINDETMNIYLSKESETYFKKITYKNILNNTSKSRQTTYFQTFYIIYSDIYQWFKRSNDNLPYRHRNDTNHLIQHQIFYYVRLKLGFIATFILIPWALISKVISFIFPFIMIYFINDINIIQQYMFYVFMVLQFIVIILFIFVIRTHYWMWHILPYEGGIKLNKQESTALFKDIVNYYKEMSELPVIDQILFNKFGINVTQIILMYCRDHK